MERAAKLRAVGGSILLWQCYRARLLSLRQKSAWHILLPHVAPGTEVRGKLKASSALAWPKATNLLELRLVCKGRHKGSLRLPRMRWQGHLACQQPPRPRSRQAGLAGSGKWQLLAATAGKACLVACLANAHSNNSTR